MTVISLRGSRGNNGSFGNDGVAEGQHGGHAG